MGASMLDIYYKKDMYGNYMVMKTVEEAELAYGMKMHLNNKIKGVLDVELHVTDNRTELYYNITSKQTIVSFLEKAQIKYEELRKILEGIIKSIENGKEYLLSEDDFVLNPECIFIFSSTLEVSLCHYAGYGLELTKQVVSMIEYLMNKVDYTDEQAVIMIYGLYKISRETNAILEDIRKFMNVKSVMQKPPIKPLEENPNENFMENKKKINQRYVGENYDTKNRILQVQEKIKDQREILCYSGFTIFAGILSILSIIVIFITMWKLEFLSSITNIFGVSLIFITAEVFILSKLFSKKNKVSKMKTISGYIEPIQEKQWIDEKNQTILLKEDKEEKTVLLSNIESMDSYRLRAENAVKYQDILIIEFPFFVGKLKTNVNCIIDNAAVSRFHAKIELLMENYYITDLNSTNGTYLNGIRLKPNEAKKLHINEKISFANVSYFFEKI